MENKKSIYEYIEASIQKNGMLPQEFNLDGYISQEQEKLFGLGAYDGMLFFLTPREPNKKFIEFITKLLKTVDEESITFYCALIDNYIADESEEIKIMDNFNIITDWIIDNQEIIDKKLLFKFATAMILISRNIETVKLGISIWGLTDIDVFPEILDSILKLALCDEFTFFSNLAIGRLKNANDIRFKIAKKVNGWGKIFIVSELEPENETIKEWLITHGCENTVHYSYLAYPVAQKVDLNKILERKDITEDEFLGISKIIIGLLNEEFCLGISKFENYIDIFTAYIQLVEEKFTDKIVYYKVPLEIARYFTKIGVRENDSEINLMIYLKNMFSLPRVEEIVISALNSTKIEDYHIAMDIIEYYNKKELYNSVFVKFKTNPLKYAHSFYFLMQNKNAQEDIINMVLDSVDKNKFDFNPTAIIGVNDEEDMAITLIVNALSYYPFSGINIIILALASNSMYPRNAALSTLEEWIKTSEIEFKDFPNEIYNAVEKLAEKEVIKKYKEKINNLLGIDENLDKYREPEIELYTKKSPNIYDGSIDELFEKKIIERGKNYYASEMVHSCSNLGDKFVAFVQASDLNSEYEVKIYCDKKGNIGKMECDCPYPNNCKHEYATLKYIREKYKKENE